MDLERWQQLNQLFDAASKLPRPEIEPYLRSACDGDPVLFREAERLVNAHLDAGDFIQKGVITQVAKLLSDQAEEATFIGQRFGPYRIEKELGRGGMGAVYLAERADDEYRKTVAIKLITCGKDADAVLRRFRHERQILATLEHPNIARLLDGGTGADGSPYFVMEYVDGGPIDKYCDENSLPLRARLELFLQVCSAVGHAHARSIIHRDLKPTNILVTSTGVPKLLDFGIAKIMQNGEGLETMHTATNVRLMTPDYASPEQLRGEPLTNLTDIFSLGVILAELVHAQKPKKGQWKTASGPKGSTETTPRLDPDLHAILRIAKHEDPESRYQSAENLSEDISRYLRGLPVHARSSEMPYRAARLLKSRKALASAAMVLLLVVFAAVLSIALGGSFSGDERTETSLERIDEVRRIAQTAPTNSQDAVKAIEFLDTLVDSKIDDVSLKQEIAKSYESIGNAQNELTAREDLNKKIAIDSYGKAVALYDAILRSASTDFDLRERIALTSLKLAKIEREIGERTDQGLDHGRRSMTLLLELAAEKPARGELRHPLMEAYYEVGQILLDAGANDAAARHYSQYGVLIESLPQP